MCNFVQYTPILVFRVLQWYSSFQLNVVKLNKQRFMLNIVHCALN